MNQPLPSLPQLKWQCRRGMLELDLLFEAFVEQRYEQLSTDDKALFVELLTYSDQDLQQWLVNRASPADPRLLPIIKLVLSPNPEMLSAD